MKIFPKHKPEIIHGDLLRITKSKLISFLLVLLVTGGLPFGSEMVKTKKIEKRNISELNPKIVMDTITHGFAFKVVVDSQIKVGRQCANWRIEPVALFTNGVACCDPSHFCGPTNAVALENHIFKIQVFKDWNDVEAGIDINDIFNNIRKEDKVYMVSNLNNLVPQYFLINKDTLVINVAIEFDANCTFSEEDEDCTQNMFDIQYFGKVVKKGIVMTGF